MEQLALTAQENQALEQCEDVIEQGLRTFVDVGNALLSIREERLYRGQYGTFENYCQERWGFVASRARQLIGAAQAVTGLETVTNVTPANEGQVRPLMKLEPEQQQEAWAQVVEENPDGHITGAKVQGVVDRIFVDSTPTKSLPTEILIDTPAMADKLAEQGEGLTEEEWAKEPETYTGHCHKQCYNDQVMVKGSVFEYGVRGIYVCSRCGYAYPVGFAPESNEPPKPHVTHNSGNNEWYTPAEYVDAARRVMEHIDLDPASSDKANETVKADTYYTAEMDGLAQEWTGRVWMNPPYASELIGAFCGKLAAHVQQGDVSEACVLVNNATETGWFNTLLDVASAVCLIKSRVKFIDADGNPSGAPLQGQAVIYIGPASADFEREFTAFGRVLYATW